MFSGRRSTQARCLRRICLRISTFSPNFVRFHSDQTFCCGEKYKLKTFPAPRLIVLWFTDSKLSEVSFIEITTFENDKKSPLKIIIIEKSPLEILYDGRGSLPVQRPRQRRAFHSQARLFTSPSELKPQTTNTFSISESAMTLNILLTGAGGAISYLYFFTPISSSSFTGDVQGN